MSNNIEDFPDTSDVSDAAIERVLKVTGYDLELDEEDDTSDWQVIVLDRIAARLVQRNYPELLVDPVVKLIREELAKSFEENGFAYLAEQYRIGKRDNSPGSTAAKRIYMLGLEKGRNGG